MLPFETPIHHRISNRPPPPLKVEMDFFVLEHCELKLTQLNYLSQGKSLSLISGSLTWLKDYEERQQKEIENAPASARNVTE